MDLCTKRNRSNRSLKDWSLIKTGRRQRWSSTKTGRRQRLVVDKNWSVTKNSDMIVGRLLVDCKSPMAHLEVKVMLKATDLTVRSNFFICSFGCLHSRPPLEMVPLHHQVCPTTAELIKNVPSCWILRPMGLERNSKRSTKRALSSVLCRN